MSARRALPAYELGAFIREGNGGPLMTDANRQRAEQFDPMIDKFRDDINAIRSGATRGSLGLQSDVQRMRDGWNQIFRSDGRRADLGNLPLTSENPLLGQTYSALERSKEQHDIRLDARTVAGVVVGVQQQGLTNIDHVTAGNGTLYAVQGRSMEDPAARVAPVNLNAAQQLSLAASSQQSAAQQTALPEPQQLQDQPQRAAATR